MARGSSFGDNSPLPPISVTPQTNIPRRAVRELPAVDNEEFVPQVVPIRRSGGLPTQYYDEEFVPRGVKQKAILSSAYYLYTNIVGRIKGQRELLLGGVRRVRKICFGVLTLFLSTWLTTTFLEKQVVDYQFLFFSIIFLGLIISIAWFLEKGS